MARYLLFSGMFYYPGGGWNDFRGSFDSVELAKDHLLREVDDRDWWHIVDTQTGEVVDKSHK